MSKIVGVITLMFFGSLPALAGITAANCKVSFFTTGKPVLVKIEGEATSGCTGTMDVSGESVSSSKFEVDLSTLDTKIALRNQHLKENYLEIAKFPKATLTLRAVTDVGAQKGGAAGKNSKFSGELDLHGVKKVINGDYSVKGKTATAKFSFKLPDFKVEPPKFMGVTVAETVDVTVTFDIQE